MTGYQQRY